RRPVRECLEHFANGYRSRRWVAFEKRIALEFHRCQSAVCRGCLRNQSRQFHVPRDADADHEAVVTRFHILLCIYMEPESWREQHRQSSGILGSPKPQVEQEPAYFPSDE